MTILSPSSSTNEKPRMAQLETLEAKMANIEVSLSSNTPRRRKGTSLGSASARASPRPTENHPSKELRSALQDREAVIQSLRVQLGLGKLPRQMGTPLEECERPAAEQRLNRLRIDADNKRVAIRNLKGALDKLDITDNIDVRIRQAELEYALGREELQLLSLVEEARALQARLDKSKPEANTLFSTIQSGVNLSLQAVQATVGRWAACSKSDSPGLWIEWALDGEGLFRGDRILEINGKVINCKTREELQKVTGISGKCQMVVVRKRAAPFQQQQLLQTQEDNQRLQHRISYLEDQVKELQEHKSEPQSPVLNRENNAHITSISITSPPTTPPEKPQIFQRGNFVTTIIGGKPVGPPQSNPKSHVTKTIIKENHRNGSSRIDAENIDHMAHSRVMSASKISINSDITHAKRERDRQREKEVRRDERERHYLPNNHINGKSNHRYSEGNNHYHGYSYARSVEHLNYVNGFSSRKKDIQEHVKQQRPAPNDLRSVKSLDFESDTGDRKREVDYTSEPVAHRVRPTPPKKPLRLSLQRAQSLQTVEASMLDSDKKRAIKRTHKSRLPPDLQYIENNIPIQTASLGRNKNV